MLLQHAAAGQGRDPPRAGRHALFADDLEDAHLGAVRPDACRRKAPC